MGQNGGGRRPDRRVVEKIASIIRKGRRFLVTAHARPDGDAMGSMIAMASILGKLGKRALAVNSGSPSEDYAFLPGFDGVVAEIPARWRDCDALFVLDCGNFDRIEDLGGRLPRGLTVVNIDHHGTNDMFGRVNWVEPGASCTGELIRELALRLRVAVDRDMAENLYVAIFTDTGRFSFSNTTPRSMEIAAEMVKAGVRPERIFRKLYQRKKFGHLKLLADCIRRVHFGHGGRLVWTEMTRRMISGAGLDSVDSQDYMDALKAIEGVAMVVLFREADRPGSVKVSLRTDATVDAGEFAHGFGGGGHPRAAGCTVSGGIPAVRRIVLARAGRYLRRAARPASEVSR